MNEPPSKNKIFKFKASKFNYWRLAGLFVLVLALSAGIYLYLNFQKIKSNIFVGETIKKIADSSKPTPTPTPTRNDINVLLLGYGGGQHDGAYLTDSIILANINHDNKKITLVSIPRDLWVSIPVSSQESLFGKINSAYAIGIDDRQYPNKASEYTGAPGGGNLTKKIVADITGLPVDKFAAIDFDGFVKSIDVLGGVEVNIEKSFTDKEYPIAGKEDDTCGVDPLLIPTITQKTGFSVLETFPCRFETITFEKGITHLDGTMALKYVRSRHSPEDGSDFGRSRRQRSLILAVRDKIISIGFIPKILPFITSLQNDFKTDFTLGETQLYLASAADLSKYEVENFAITDQNFLEHNFSARGQAILEPAAGQDSWEEIHQWLQIVMKKDKPVVKIVNCASQDKLESVTTFLKENNYFVLPVIDKCQNTKSKTAISFFEENDPNFDKNKLLEYLQLENPTKLTQTDNSYQILINLSD